MPRYQYTISEPHPTVPQNTYTHVGRGGAGNFFRAPLTTPSNGVATHAQEKDSNSDYYQVSPCPTYSSSSSTKYSAETASHPSAAARFYSGRGGAGNAQPASQRRPMLSFDEEYRLQSQVQKKSRGHVGRGGAGNVFTVREDPELGRVATRGSSSSSSSSCSSEGSASGEEGAAKKRGFLLRKLSGLAGRRLR